jgi:hypothetical protein
VPSSGAEVSNDEFGTQESQERLKVESLSEDLMPHLRPTIRGGREEGLRAGASARKDAFEPSGVFLDGSVVLEIGSDQPPQTLC